MTNGRLNIVFARIRAQWVSRRCSTLNTKNSGNAASTGGNMRVDRTQNERFSPPVRNRAKE